MNARSSGTAGLRIDGKLVRKFLFARQRRIALPHQQFIERKQVVEVEAFHKDHAIERLIERHKESNRHEWEFIEELEPEQFLGALGESLPFLPFGVTVSQRKS